MEVVPRTWKKEKASESYLRAFPVPVSKELLAKVLSEPQRPAK